MNLLINPGREFGLMRREMDRLVDHLLPARDERDSTAVWTPRTDLAETEDAYVLTMDLPGIDPEEVDITYEDGHLRVAGERRIEEERQDGQFHRVERSYGRFFRSFHFGDNADADKIDADFDEGVLTVTVAKREQSKPRRIKVGRRALDNGNGHTS